MANQGINYTSRNYADIRTDLINMVRQYYPEIFNDFNDASVGMMLLELNAAVGDMLSFNTDRMFQETQIDYAKERKSLLSMARTFGLNIPGKRPSATLVDFSFTLPVFGDSFDITYAPVIKAGTQVSGGGKIFETQNDIDFANPFNTSGTPNRTIIPNYDSNGVLVNYTVTKKEIVINGYTKYFKRITTAEDVVPFLQIVLPDQDIISIDSIIMLDGTTINGVPPSYQFYDPTLRWYEVPSLAEDKIFVEYYGANSNTTNYYSGKWVSVTKKFISEKTDLGFTKLTFGGGTQDISTLSDFDTNPELIQQIGNFVNNMALGETLSANKTIFVKYRVGGGADTNLGPNTITSLGIVNVVVNGSVNATNALVRNSLRVTNPIPAFGGKNEPGIEEIRNMVKYNFSSQNRAVTLKDYQTLISQMPSNFGVPFRCGVVEEQNKIKVYVLNLNADGTLSNSSSDTLNSNIAEYLSQYRMINDYVEVSNGNVYNISMEIDIFANKNVSTTQIISDVVSQVSSYMSISNFEMGDNIYLSPLIETINNVGGVLNVVDIKIYSKVGVNYSNNETNQPYVDDTTKQIDLTNYYMLFGESNSMYEIKYPNIDIMVKIL
jgi:hypothetical protein